MGKPISGSPNITLLDFNILYDISGASPSITLTNTSVGPSLNLCTWWITAYTPSNTPIHIGSQSIPDFPAQTWTTYTIPDEWPTPMSEGLCAQVEFSCSTPYVITLYVMDANGAIFSFAISTPICAPNGATLNTCGNWGAALFNLDVLCTKAQIFGQDKTNYIYNGIPPTVSPSQNWVMTYPIGAAGNPIPNATATNTASVYFPVYYVGEGYAMYLNTICSYVFGEATIKIQYKSQNAQNPQFNIQKTSFSVWCNIDTCKLQCEIAKYLKKVKRSCNTIENAQYQQTLTMINALYLLVLDGIIHPLCGSNVTDYIKEIERLGEFECDCCNKFAPGINLANLVPNPSAGGCCPTDSNIIDKNSGVSPVNCATGGYFPVNVYDPTGTTVIGNASNIDGILSILNSNAGWEAYGTAFNMGNCQVGWYALNSGTIIPVIKVLSTGSGQIIPPLISVSKLYQVGSSWNIAPIGCPVGNPYPLRIYDPTGTTVIGIANNIIDVVNLLNSTASWSTYGTASVQDNCSAQWNLKNGNNIAPYIPTDTNTTSSTCVNNNQLYVVNMVDICYPNTQISASSFPCDVIVNFGSGPVALGMVANNAAMIAALNGAAGKPASIIFSATSIVGQILVTNTNCTAYSGTITVQCDAGSTNFLLFGGNYSNQKGITPTVNGEYGIGLRDMAVVGRIPGATNSSTMWHTIKIQNYIIVSEGNTGKIYFYDVTNPLVPVLAQTIQLTALVSSNFAGQPQSATFCHPSAPLPLSLYSLYFPTDFYSPMGLTAVYVFEGTTGCAWSINFFTGAINAAFQDNRLLGKCPRCLINTVNNKSDLYFTQDGDLEQAAGLTSGVAKGDIVVMHIGSGFTSGSLATLTILGSGIPVGSPAEYVWAASYDGSANIYFSGVNSSVTIYNPTTATTVGTYRLVVSGGGFSFQYRLNTVIAQGNIYWVAKFTFAFYIPFMPLALISTTPAVSNFQIPGGVALVADNFLPLGNCLGVLTGVYDASPCGNGAMYLYKMDGTFVSSINMPANGAIYNVVAIQNVGVYTPTSMT